MSLYRWETFHAQHELQVPQLQQLLLHELNALTCLPVRFVFSSDAIELQCLVPFSTISFTISSSYREVVRQECCCQRNKCDAVHGRVHMAVHLFEIPCSLEHACNVHYFDQKTNVACCDQMDFARLINRQKVTVAG